MALSIDLRERIISAFEQGELNRRQIAERFDVSYGAVCKLVKLWTETGSIEPRYGNCTGRPPKIGPEKKEKLRDLLAKQPDLTLAELRTQADLDCTLEAICIALKKMELTYKKRLSVPVNKNEKMLPSDENSGLSN